MSRRYRLWLLVVIVAGLLGGCTLGEPSPTPPPVTGSGGDWPMYMGNAGRNSYNQNETTITAATAASLRPLWISDTHAAIVAQPSVASGTVYIGNWVRGNNFFKLDAATGHTIWSVNLGFISPGRPCEPTAAGVSSGAAIVSDTVYVGGGDNWYYALDAATGTTRWRYNTAQRETEAYTGNYNWSSPLVVSGSVYVGVASFADCPLVQGKLLKLDASTGAVQAVFKAVPDGQVGGTIWTSPSYDAATNTVLVTTGNHDLKQKQPMAEAVVQLDATDLRVIGSWRVPDEDLRGDSDWGGTLNIFLAGGRNYAATVHKNGKLYIFDTQNVTAGPVTTTQLSAPYDCPQCGAGNLSSPAFTDGTLYVAGPRVKWNDVYYGGTIGAVQPPTYSDFLWRKPTALDPRPPRTSKDICQPDQDATCPRTPGVIIGPVIGAGGVVAVNTSWETQLRDSSSGQLLFTSKVITDTRQPYNALYAGSSFASGRMFLPTAGGTLYAYAPGLTRSDDFDSDTLGKQWYADGDYKLADGKLQLTGPAQAMQWPLGGDFAAWTVTTTLELANGTTGLTAMQDDDNRINLSRTGPQLNFSLRSNTILEGERQSPQVVTLDAGQPQLHLRLSKSAQADDLLSSYTAAYSYDGKAWTELQQPIHAYFGLLRVGPFAGSGTARFAEFGISPGN